ncbi:MAG TPA: PilT/PilU family type 4a pilus ATPase [Polyangiaceae bacterium]|nr:PilT/PilU family type 4a pilus ATPase [Polyangiaceae bacterium]
MSEPKLHAYFRRLVEQKGSDLHLAAGRRPAVRAHGEVEPLSGEAPLEDRAMRAMLRELVDEVQWQTYADTGDLDFAYELSGTGRFRGNYLEQETGAGAVFRLVPENIVPIENLGLPPVVSTLADLESGLVLVTGPTGSGKSTTLASIIDLINRKHSRHIVTIEDPLEFVHQCKRSVISHREVGRDTGSFAAALKAALREDADVVLVGELRDLETIALAIEGASMGVLVFGTLHTSSAAKTVDRVISAFPSEQQAQARVMFADSVAAVVSQILCRKVGGGRVAAHEILIRTTGVVGAIREGKTSMVHSMMGAGRAHGMQIMDDALAALLAAGSIDAREAYMKAVDKGRFKQGAA